MAWNGKLWERTATSQRSNARQRKPMAALFSAAMMKCPRLGNFIKKRGLFNWTANHFIDIHMHLYTFCCCFLRQSLIYPRLALNLLGSLGWPWTSASEVTECHLAQFMLCRGSSPVHAEWVIFPLSHPPQAQPQMSPFFTHPFIEYTLTWTNAILSPLLVSHRPCHSRGWVALTKGLPAPRYLLMGCREHLPSGLLLFGSELSPKAYEKAWPAARGTTGRWWML